MAVTGIEWFPRYIFEELKEENMQKILPSMQYKKQRKGIRK